MGRHRKSQDLFEDIVNYWGFKGKTEGSRRLTVFEESKSWRVDLKKLDSLIEFPFSFKFQSGLRRVGMGDLRVRESRSGEKIKRLGNL